MSEFTFTGSSLEEAVKSGSLERPMLELTGMVKASEQEGSIAFARGGCETWIDLPTHLIDKAEQLGQKPCRDHVHPVFRITLKEPADPEAKLFASMLTMPMSGSSMEPFRESASPGPAAQMRPDTRGRPAFQSAAQRAGAPRTPAGGPVQFSAGRRWGGWGGFGRPPLWGGDGDIWGAWGCWSSECCDCLRYELVCNGTACWDVCTEWTCYPCERCVWPW